jgi:hypothetical protein
VIEENEILSPPPKKKKRKKKKRKKFYMRFVNIDFISYMGL